MEQSQRTHGSKRNVALVDNSSLSSTKAGSSGSAQPSADAQPGSTPIPGYVWNGKRYFRVGSGAPANNFTVPVSLLTPGAPRLRFPWIHPEISSSMSEMDLLNKCELPVSGENPYSLKRRSVASAYNHTSLAKIGRVPAVYKWAQTGGQVPNQESPEFHTVDVLLNADMPRAFFVSDKTGAAAKNGVEFRTANFDWKNDELIARDFRMLKAGSFLPAELCTVHSVVMFSPGLAFFSCVAGNSTYRIGLCICERNNGIHSIPVITSHDVVTASKTLPLVATGSRESSEIRVFSLGDMSFTSIVLTDDEHDEVFCCSLDFRVTHPNDLLVGTNVGSVVQVDHREEICRTILSAGIWKEIGIAGKCIVKGIKTLNTQNRFVTSIAGLPAESPKMHLWDARYLKSPVSFFEETGFPFSRRSFPVSLSQDDTVAVCSDGEGTARLWDVNSGLLMAKVPVRNYDTESKVAGWMAPIAFYSDACTGTAGRKALVIAQRGSDPRLSVISL